MATSEQGLNVDVERDGDTVIARCSGRLVAGLNEGFYNEVSRLIPSAKKIVLDLSGVTYMDSMGLGAVIRLYVSTKSAGVELELVNLGKRIRELLGMTNLLGVFTICGEHHIRVS